MSSAIQFISVAHIIGNIDMEAASTAKDAPALELDPLDFDIQKARPARDRLSDFARQEAKRRHLLEVMSSPSPIWNPADHPELEEEGGAAGWVKKLRRQAERALEKRTRSRDGE